MSKQGIVYVLLNPTFKDLLKIGKTQGTSEQRANQLSSHTAIPEKFIVAYDIEVTDCDLVERNVHSRLHIYRQSLDREFFKIPLKDAIKAIDKVIKELNKQYKIEFIEQKNKKLLSNEEWWAELSIVWQQIFRSHLNLSYNPNEIDLLEAVHTIIDHCQNDLLRAEVANLIKDKKFTSKLENWYKRLKIEKDLFNSYLPYQLSGNEIDQLLSLKSLNCSNNIAVIDLMPVVRLSNLEKIDCKNTSVSDLQPLRYLLHLEEINLNLNKGKIETLAPLEHLSNLKKIRTYPFCYRIAGKSNNKRRLSINKI